MKIVKCDICGKDTHFEWGLLENVEFQGFGYACILPKKETPKDICLDCGNALQKAINETITNLKQQ